VKCPECVAEGKRSTVSVGAGTTTCMYFAPYYDEDGAYHHHDGNTTSYSHTCSNGHSWCSSRTGTCPAPGCIWNNK